MDNPGHRLDDLVIDARQQPEARPVSVLGGVVTIRVRAALRNRSDSGWWPYANTPTAPMSTGPWTPVTAVPYFVCGNRGEGSMRVWIPAE